MSDNTAAVSIDSKDQASGAIYPSTTKDNAVGSSGTTNSNPSNGEVRGSSGSNNRGKSRSIGNYVLGKTLGEGTFGKVKGAVHTLTGEKVAVKILEKDRIVDVSDVERVAREIHILKLIRHPNIIQLYEIIETPKHLFLVMEYANGGELFEYIVAHTRVREKEASRFFHEIISGIEYIHKLNIVHRDLKPENLLLDCTKSIKMVDFGLSNTYKNGELLKTACGSPCYAAPEMIAGKKYHGLTVDIWSSGVILFALICGYLPFEDPNTSNLYKKILSGDYSIPKFVSSEGKDLIRNILTTDPAKRYTIEDIRRHPWMNQVKLPREPEGIIIGYHQVPIDHNILKQLEGYGINTEYAYKCLDANKHNHVTTTYYLLLKKFKESGGKSPADINSSAFEKSLLIPKARQQKTNNFVNPASAASEASKEKEKEKEKSLEREKSLEKEKSRERSVEKNARTFILNYLTSNPRKPREKIKISGSINASSSREGDMSALNYSSNGSRGTSIENSRINQSSDARDRSQEIKPNRPPAMKNTSSREGHPVLMESNSKDLTSPTQNIYSRAQRRSKILNKSINNEVLKEKLNIIENVGRTKPTRATPLVNESFASPKYIFNGRGSRGGNMSVNHDVLNESIKLDAKSYNIAPINTGNIISSIAAANHLDHNQTISDYNTKRVETSHHSTPKERKVEPHPPSREKVRQRDSSLNNSYMRETKPQPIKTNNNPPIAWPNQNQPNQSQHRQQPQSPSRNYDMISREPVMYKPENFMGNTQRAKVQIGKAGRVRFVSNEPRPAKIAPPQSRERDPSRMGSMMEDRGRISYYNDNSQGTSANTSYILNGSFQNNIQNNSFEFYPPSRPSLNNSVIKAYQTGDGNSRRIKQQMMQIVAPMSLYNTNAHHLSSKRG